MNWDTWAFRRKLAAQLFAAGLVLSLVTTWIGGYWS